MKEKDTKGQKMEVNDTKWQKRVVKGRKMEEKGNEREEN